MPAASSSSHPSLPPYLTSGASSRAHHALLVRLNEASSTQEEDEIISKEIGRAKEAMTTKGLSTAKIAVTLIVLLHCSMLRHRTDNDIEIALVYALQLAEGGRTLSERRIGYLYLVERLPHGHELGLLLINTIRKDLSSTSPSHILLALHSIIKLPFTDLAPAVTPLLTSKVLLKHKFPAVRQRTLEALLALHRKSAREEASRFPLSMSKILRLLEREDETPVISVLYRTIRVLLESDVHRVETEGEADYIAEVTLQSATTRHGSRDTCQVDVELLRTLGAITRLQVKLSETVSGDVSKWLIDRLRTLDPHRPLNGAFLLQSCYSVSAFSQVTDHCLRHISRVLLSDTVPSSSTSPPPLPRPNDHILALRCLMNLPRDTWDGKLGENEMGVIMEGVNSADSAIRRTTLRLLAKNSPELPEMIFKGYLESLRDSTRLSLPASIAPNLTIEEKTATGRAETASRALEVIDISSGTDGQRYANSVAQLIEVFDAEERTVWEEGVRVILDRVRAEPQAFGDGFTAGIGRTLSNQPRPPGHTVMAILCTVVCEYPPASRLDLQGIITLLSTQILDMNASVQELILISLVALVAGGSDEAQDTACHQVMDAVRSLSTRRETSRYLQKRCAEVITIIEQGLLKQVKFQAEAGNLPDLSNAISRFAADHYREEQKKKKDKDKDNAQQREAYSRSLTQSQSSLDGGSLGLAGSRSSMITSQLRYDAYEPPVKHKQAKGSRLDRSAYRDRVPNESDSE